MSRSHKTHFHEVRANPKGISPILLLTNITSTAAAKHMHKGVPMQVRIEQQQSGDRMANVKLPPHHDGKC